MTETPREINRHDYAGRQQQILDALALLDDLAQDASDLGQTELSARLHQAYADIERFRVLTPPPVRRHYFQLGRSKLLHVVEVDPNVEDDKTFCGRSICETGRLADDVDDQPLCEHCLRKLERVLKERRA